MLDKFKRVSDFLHTYSRRESLAAMPRKIVSTLFVLVIATSHSFKFRDDEEYSDDDADYDKDFQAENVDWLVDSTISSDTPLNLKGSLRNSLVVDAALANPERSMVCSPVSALLPLGKLALGAEGKCLRQLLTAIGLISQSQIAKAFKPLISSLEYLKGVTLNIVSKIYVSKEVKLRSKFRQQSKKIFKSAVVTADFTSPAKVARDINDWVSKNTKNMIPNIISERDISSSTSLILLNAVYFKGLWKDPFKKVREDKFFTPSATRMVPMMTREGYYNYGNSDDLDAQIVEIPYEGEEASFVIVLPNSKHGLPVLLHKVKLAPKLLQKALDKLYRAELILTIPKFRTQTELDLKVAYEKLGLTEMFQTSRSGLENIVKGRKNIYVSKAIQKAVIEVSELGTKASAVTVTDLKVVSQNLHKIIFNANRPFMYYIKFKGEQLFSGIFSP